MKENDMQAVLKERRLILRALETHLRALESTDTDGEPRGVRAGKARQISRIRALMEALR